MTDAQPSGEVILYHREDGAPTLHVRFDAETVWLSQQQIAELLQTSRTNVVEHIQHVYDEGELDEAATCRKFRQVRVEGPRRVARELPFYNLDAILSVGYRVKIATATQFRIWATRQLREYLVRGYVVNEQRLEKLDAIVHILHRSTDELLSGVADVLQSYLPGLTLLRDYDDGKIDAQSSVMPAWELTLDDAHHIVTQLRKEFPADTLLGRETRRQTHRNHRNALPELRRPRPLPDRRGKGSQFALPRRERSSARGRQQTHRRCPVRHLPRQERHPEQSGRHKADIKQCSGGDRPTRCHERPEGKRRHDRTRDENDHE